MDIVPAAPPAPRSPAPAAPDRLIIVLLIIAAVAPFVSSLGFGYVLDDTTVIRWNPAIPGWSSLAKVWTEPYGGLTSHYSGLYRPLLMTLFAFVWNAGGQWPLWFHLLCVVMHAIATVMVWRVLGAGVSRTPALFGALWFAVHPLHIEAVANIANSSEVLVAIWTCAFALYLGRAERHVGRIPWRRAVAAGALYLAAFLTKESGAVVPVLAAVWLWGWRRPRADMSVSRWAPVLVGCAVAALFVFILRGLVLGDPVTRVSIAAAGLEELSMPRRIWTMLSLGPTIVGLLVLPGAPNPHYGPTALPQAMAWPAAATIFAASLVIGLAAWLAKRGDRRLLAALGWTFVAFLPASNVLVATGQLLAERTLYVSSIGVAMVLAAALDALAPIAKMSRAARIAAALLAAVVIPFLAMRTAAWTGFWRSNATVFAQMIAADGAGYRGYWMSGMEARYRGRLDESIALFERAHALYPRDRGLIMDYSSALSQRGDHARAAAVAAKLMAWPTMRAEPNAVGLYLDALGRAYGPDSVVAAARRLMADAPSPAAAQYLDRALRSPR